MASKKYIDEIHKAGLKTFVWTVNDESKIQEIIEMAPTESSPIFGQSETNPNSIYEVRPSSSLRMTTENL